MDYVSEITRLKKIYKSKINIYCGLEAEYHRDEYEYYKTLRNTPGIDYMILGNHNMGNPHEAKE
jgi:histidinol phosphatase-like PHP family hydrolase